MRTKQIKKDGNKMRKKKAKTFISTINGECSVISFKEFLKLVPIKPIESKEFQIVDMRSMGCAGFTEDGEPIESSYPSYTKRTIKLQKGYGIKKALQSLQKQAPPVALNESKSIEDFYEDMLIDNMEHFGAAPYLVELGYKKMAPLDPGDFVLAVNDKKNAQALVCLYTGRLKIWKRKVRKAK